MKTKNYLLLFALLISSYVQGQDTLLFKKNGPKPVTILNENSSNVNFKNFNDPLDTAKHMVNKRKLKGIRYQNDSASFASMTASDFYSLGQKHAKEYGTPNELLINNTEYMKGYSKQSKKGKTLKTIVIITGAATATLFAIAGIVIALESAPMW